MKNNLSHAYSLLVELRDKMKDIHKELEANRRAAADIKKAA